MGKKIYAVIVAGGCGSRMGASIPKQFLEIEGVPVLQRTISRFVDALPKVSIITVLPRQHFEMWKSLCIKYNFNVPQTLIEGGHTRFHSVRNALDIISDPEAVVMIHDGVRPLMSNDLVRRMAESAQKGVAAVPVMPVTDTLRYQDARQPDPDRGQIDAVQTPQVFIAEDIKSAYTNAYDTSFTDDVSVALRAGLGIKRIPGEKYNIKLTTPEDMIVASLLISSCRPDGSLCELK